MGKVAELFNPKSPGPTAEQKRAQQQQKTRALDEKARLDERRSRQSSGRPGRQGRSLLEFSGAKTDKKTLGV